MKGTDLENSHPHRSSKPMRSRIWSTSWFRLFLSLVVLGAVYSSPLLSVAPSVKAGGRPARCCHLPRNFVRVTLQQTGSPVRVRRIGLLRSLLNACNESSLDESAGSWAFSTLSPLTQNRWAVAHPSPPSRQSNLSLRC
jgi:hypothetical protein